MNRMTRDFIVTFVRHGETTLNAQRLLQGHTDAPLSEKGISQARLLGKHMSNVEFTRVFASDLTRASNTAKIIMEESKYPKQVTMDPRLRERCYGEAEGKPVLDFHNSAGNYRRILNKLQLRVHKSKLRAFIFKLALRVWEYTPDGGETSAEVEKRAREFFYDLCTIADSEEGKEGGNILVVSHGGWLISMFRTVTHSDHLFDLIDFHKADSIRSLSTVHRNTGVTRVRVSRVTRDDEKRRLTLLSVNDVEHLNSEEL